MGTATLPPPKEAFTQKEWAVIKDNPTPSKVQKWLNSLKYNTRKPATMFSFREVVRRSTVHCLEAAMAAAVILEQHGHPLRFLDLDSKDDLGHVLFLYKKDGLWGTVARSRDPGLHGRKPVFRTIRDIVESYFDPFIDLTGRITSYAVGDFKGLGNYDWRFSRRNVWRVEKYFIDIPHRPWRSSDHRYNQWFERFKAFKRRYPDRRPIYFNDRERWLPGYRKFI
jgi:hypothetical protein